jgi:ATP-dependent RNA helicase DDX5/DBP2
MSWNGSGYGGYGGGGGGGGWGAQALPYSSGAGNSAIAQACEAAAAGATGGSTVQDHEIKVTDPTGYPTQPFKFTTFDECQDFPYEVVMELKSAGFPGPSQIQAYAWPLACQGKDVIGIAATGSGKTLAFLLPAFSQFHRQQVDPYRAGAGLLVLSPTRELAQQIEAEAQRFGKCIGISTVAMYGGSPKQDQMRTYRGGVHCIVACPGRLNDFLEGGQVRLDGIKSLVLDEADRMLDMGFEPQIRKILARVPRMRHTMFFTATWPKDVRKLAAEILYYPFTVMIGERDELKANQDVTQIVRVVDGWGKNQAMKDLINEAGLMSRSSQGKCLVFASTKRMCEQLSQELHRAGVSCASIHGDKGQQERDRALEGLKRGEIRVLVATDVAARGLDIKGVGLVINYDAANNTEDYVHRIGRTGRAGAKGFAVTFMTRQDGGKAQGLIKVMESTGQEITQDLRDLAANGFSGGRNRGRGGGGGGGGGYGGGSRGRSRSPRRW